MNRKKIETKILNKFSNNSIPKSVISSIVNDVIDLALIEYENNFTFAPKQLCPKCRGDGNLLRYNSPAVMGTTTMPVCDLCKGQKTII